MGARICFVQRRSTLLTVVRAPRVRTRARVVSASATASDGGAWRVLVMARLDHGPGLARAVLLDGSHGLVLAWRVLALA